MWTPISSTILLFGPSHFKWWELNFSPFGPCANRSGGAGELPPCAPTEPYVTVSRHTALVAEPFIARVQTANVQTSQGRS